MVDPGEEVRFAPDSPLEGSCFVVEAGPQKIGFAIDSALEGDGFEPSVPREGVKGPSPQFHADYPPIGWAHKQRMKRMLNGFKRRHHLPGANGLPAGSAQLS